MIKHDRCGAFFPHWTDPDADVCSSCYPGNGRAHIRDLQFSGLSYGPGQAELAQAVSEREQRREFFERLARQVPVS